MTKPGDLPIWDLNETNATIPAASRQSDGWLAPAGVPEKPPFQYFNWWQNNVYKWIDEINTKGVLEYDAAVDYVANLSYVVGSDGNQYNCLINNGPATTPVNPVADLTGTWASSSRNYSGIRLITTNVVLTKADIGKALLFVKLADISATLPLANSVRAGSVISLSTAVLANGIATITGQGADSIVIDGSVAIFSFTMAPASDMELVSNGSSIWYAQGGLAKLKSNIGEFGFSKVTNGYQKFPSGVIIQWMSGLTIAGVLSMIFPIAFPTLLTGISMNGSANNIVLNYTAETVTGLTVNSNTGHTAAPTASFFKLIVIGY